MNGYCGMARYSRDDGYCSGCPHYDCGSIFGGCDAYRNYLSVLAECLKGKENGLDPCDGCTIKGEWNCPKFGVEKDHFAELEDELEENLPPMEG